MQQKRKTNQRGQAKKRVSEQILTKEKKRKKKLKKEMQREEEEGREERIEQFPNHQKCESEEYTNGVTVTQCRHISVLE